MAPATPAGYLSARRVNLGSSPGWREAKSGAGLATIEHYRIGRVTPDFASLHPGYEANRFWERIRTGREYVVQVFRWRA
jgi:hypothetical protein